LALQVHAGQYRQQFLHRQDRHSELDDVSTLTRQRQVRLTAIHYAQLHRQLA
jgi:hypothetical protein